MLRSIQLLGHTIACEPRRPRGRTDRLTGKLEDRFLSTLGFVFHDLFGCAANTREEQKINRTGARAARGLHCRR
jgi:hypothetical protein